MDRDTISQIKQAADCRTIFARFWPEHFRTVGNCHCPWHDDKTGSLQISHDAAYCHACGYKYDQIDLYAKAQSLSTKEAIPKFAKELNLNGKKGGKIVAAYDYVDLSGNLLYQSVRFEPKDFRQRRPDPLRPGKWAWNLDRTNRIPYRLPELVRADTVWIVEGEKDADRLASLGLAATTNSEGAGKWRPELSAFFTGKHVVIVPDNDDPGRKHAGDVAKKLLASGAVDVRIVYLPDLPEKGDVSDWLNAGGTVEKLIDLTAEVGVLVASPITNDASSSEQLPSIESVSLTEDGIALAFEEKFGEELKYCHDTGAWFQWDMTRWRQEKTGLAFDWARSLCREVNYCGKGNIAKAATSASVEKFCRHARRFAVTSETWDQDIWLLGTPTGTINLRNGRTFKTRREDFITKQTLVGPSENSGTNLWAKFLLDATRGDAGLIRFLQQMAGMCLTGSTREHALFFIYGPGGNGKSVFLNTLVNILGDYARTASMDTFTASRSERHPTDLAMLRGARLVTASETEEGRTWAESRIKQLTGGDRIAARFMRQDFFEYQPQFKLVIIGNHKPVLKNVDAAARRRFNVIPFIYQPSSPDKLLEEKLRSEYPLILSWMIDGCLDWQRNGLVRPKVVDEATESYFEEQDFFGRWIDEHCIVGPHEWETTTRLFSNWKTFAEQNGEYPGNARSLSLKLSKRGFEADRMNVNGSQQRTFKGLSLAKLDQ